MAYLLFLVILLGLISYFLLSLSGYDSTIKLNKQHIYMLRWRSWLRHCATNRKVAGSIPDGVIGTLH